MRGWAGCGGDAEAVEVFGGAGGVGEVVEAHEVIPVGRQGEVEQGVVVGVVAVGQVAVIHAELPALGLILFDCNAAAGLTGQRFVGYSV